MVNADTTIYNASSEGHSKPRRFNWPRIFGYDFFISFKLPLGASFAIFTLTAFQSRISCSAAGA